MDLKWITTYMVLAHGLSYNVVRTVLHCMIFNDGKLCDLLYSHITNLLFKHNWIIIGSKTQTIAFQNSEIAAYYQDENNVFSRFLSTAKKYPRKVIAFGGGSTFHLSDAGIWTHVVENNLTIAYATKKGGHTKQLSVEQIFRIINKLFI